MTERYLTITLQPDWKGALRAMAQAAKADEYQGEVLNFESPATSLGNFPRNVGKLFAPRKAKAICRCEN